MGTQRFSIMVSELTLSRRRQGKMETGVTRIREAAEVLRGQELNLQVEGHGEYFFFFFQLMCWGWLPLVPSSYG